MTNCTFTLSKELEGKLKESANNEKCSISFFARHLVYKAFGETDQLMDEYRKAVLKISEMEIGNTFYIDSIIESSDLSTVLIIGAEVQSNAKNLGLKIHWKTNRTVIFEKE